MNIKNFLKWSFSLLIIFGTILACGQLSAEYDSQTWMARVLDRTKLCEMNIPGTHNSGSQKMSLGKGISASYQDDSISDQLKNGIRCLDIEINSDLSVNYGGVPCYKSTFEKLYLEDVFGYVSDFLKRNSSETVIIRLKTEAEEEEDFIKKIDKELWKHKNIYLPWKNPSDLTLGDTRGKMVIFSGIKGILKAYIYDRWAENCPCWQLNIGKSPALLQDAFGDKNEIEKMSSIEEFYKIVWGKYSFTGIFYINFTGCSGSRWPKLAAKNVNKSLKSFVEKNRTKKFGMIFMDNPDSSLICDIYNLNHLF